MDWSSAPINWIGIAFQLLVLGTCFYYLPIRFAQLRDPAKRFALVILANMAGLACVLGFDILALVPNRDEPLLVGSVATIMIVIGSVIVQTYTYHRENRPRTKR